MGHERRFWKNSRDSRNRIPEPGAPWNAIYQFTDQFDGYAYTESIGQDPEEFLEAAESKFNEKGDIPDNPDALLTLIYLICRRIRWNEYGNSESLENAVRPFLDAILEKIAAQT
jgi:hypothetical protein